MLFGWECGGVGRLWTTVGLALAISAGATDAAAAGKKGHFIDIVASPTGVPSSEADDLLQHIRAAHDNKGLTFAVVDKRLATVHVFDSNGTWRASSPVLLGLARGDDSVPGIGERKMSDIKPAERTTPAGRFSAEPGENSQGEDIIWVDYDAAVSMHRVRTGNKADRRLQRLATPSVADNRITYGCINVPAAFYDKYLRSTLGSREGLVYILPETRPLAAQFADLWDK
jgi:hypothetical protein